VQATVAATAADSNGFLDLGLPEAVLQALRDVGYEAPTPIQAQTIPVLLAGSDVLGQAQTGTGKTGAFALPVLSKIDLSKAQTQALVLVPTRELAIQVAEAFQRYATHMKGFHVLPIYGGQSYTPQLKGLKRGAHVIVGTPGRVMDHMKRGTLPLGALTFLVLDEADEMLQMGFIDAIEWILEQSPPERQIALFSATIPPAIRRIAQRHQRKPAEITIRSRTSTAPNIRQRYWLVSGMHKLDALTRILEVETFDAMLVFVRTKLETVELAERLEARGFEAAPLNGDIPQPQRERTIAALKSGKVDIVVATDVAARGLDVERISHVVNYDVPYDSESYIHRIGRTGRAGRSGEAILFIAPRERNMLRIIERATRQQIAQMNLPSVAAVNEQRVARFKQRIADTLAGGETAAFRAIVEEFEAENEVPAIEIAAALASLLQGAAPLLLPEKAHAEESGREWGRQGQDRDGPRGQGSQSRNGRDRGGERKGTRPGDRSAGERRGPQRERGDDAHVLGGGDRAAGVDREPRGEHAADAKRNPRVGRGDDLGRPRSDDRVAGGSDPGGERTSDGGDVNPGSERAADGERSPRVERGGHVNVGGFGEIGQTPTATYTGDARASHRTPGDEGDDVGQSRGDDRVVGGADPRGDRATDGERNSPTESAADGEGHPRSERAANGERQPRSERAAGDDRNSRTERAVDGERNPRTERAADGEGDLRTERAVDGEHNPRSERAANGEGHPRSERVANGEAPPRSERAAGGDRNARGEPAVGGDRNPRGERASTDTGGARASRRRRGDTEDVVFETFRLEVGHAHGVKPGNIVGAIANEAGLEGRHIGQVDIRDDHSFVDLPEGMPKDIFRNLKKVRVVGQELRISRVDGKPPRN
jgi:ATP-dependent RNA helicase DeaD